MNSLLTLDYWFSFTPIPFQPWAERTLLVVFSVLIAAGLVVWAVEVRSHYEKMVKRVLGRTASHLIWTGIAGLFLWVCAYESVSLFSMRALYIAWLAWVLIGAWFIIRYVWKDIPAMEAKHRERIEREKWLPKPKR